MNGSSARRNGKNGRWKTIGKEKFKVSYGGTLGYPVHITKLLIATNKCIEMIDIYVSKGLTSEDARLVIETMAKYENFFVDIMMQQELELQVPEEDHVEQSMKEGEF